MKKRLAIYPFLLCLFPILALYSENIDQVPFSQILLPAIVMLSFTLVLLLLTKLIFKDGKKAILIVTIILVLFYSFGHVLRKTGVWEIINLSSASILLIIWVLLCVISVYFALKTRSDLSLFSKIYNVVIFSLFAVSIFNITVYQIKKFSARTDESINPEIAASKTTASKDIINRDIYYIILDAYAGSKTLQDVYGFDNHEFTDYLSEKGFYVASQSRSNYATTFLSLASSLNMEHLTPLSESEDADSKDRETPYKMIKENKVTSFLRQRGYKFIHFSSGWGATDYNKTADMEFRYGWGNEFLLVLIKTTLLAYFENEFAEGNNRERILKTFEKLSEMDKIEGPKFIFAHIACPHPPYIFDATGGKVPRVTLEMEGQEWQKKQDYLDQLNFISKKVKELMNAILTESKTPPIIILQADHGSASLGRPHPPLKLTNNEIKNQVRERMRILNAYYLPGGGDSVLYDSISPVNTFRSVFDFYFGSSYGLLKDLSYYGDYETPYLLTDVTDIVRSQ